MCIAVNILAQQQCFGADDKSTVNMIGRVSQTSFCQRISGGYGFLKGILENGSYDIIHHASTFSHTNFRGECKLLSPVNIIFRCQGIKVGEWLQEIVKVHFAFMLVISVEVFLFCFIYIIIIKKHPHCVGDTFRG